MGYDEIMTAVTEILRQVGLPGAVTEINADTDLVECGLLDSYGKVELLDAIWEQFHVELSPGVVFTKPITAEKLVQAIIREL